MLPEEKVENSTLILLSKRYQKILIGGSLLMLLACLVLTSQSYNKAQQQLLAELASDVDIYGHSASTAGELAENHVARLKQRFMNDYVLYNWQQQRQLFKSANVNGAPSGFAMSASEDPNLRSITPQILAKPDYFQSGGSEKELERIFHLTSSMREGHQTNPQLVWSYFFSSNKNLLAIYPWVQMTDLVLAQNYSSISALVEDYFKYEIALNSDPAINPTGEPHWSEPYVDAGGKGLMVSHVAPVYVDGKYIGLIGTDILLEVFNDFVSHINLRAGRLWLISKGGQVIADSGEAEAPQKLIELTKQVPWLDSSEARVILSDHGGEFQSLDGHHLLALPVSGTPWTLVYAVDDGDLFWQILPRLVPYLATLFLIIISFLGALWLLRRLFISPAISLVGYIHKVADKDDFSQPKLPELWQPLTKIIDSAFRNSSHHLRQLEESEHLKSGIIEAAPVCIISANTRCEIIEFNPEAERCFGYRAEDVLGKNMTDLIIPPHLREAHRQGFSRFCRSQQGKILGQRVELSAMRVDGSEFPVELNIVASRRGEDLIITAFIVDLTERKQSEQELRRQRDLLHQSEKLNAMGSLLANVAHELNNPLAVVVGRSIMLEEQLSETQNIKSITKIREAAERCVRIVRTFLAMARQKDQDQRPVQINDLVMMAIDIEQHALKTSGIDLKVALTPDLPLVSAAADQLHQVFLNLIVNAQQALVETAYPRRLEISTHRAGSQIHVCVADGGPGVPEVIRSRIFEPYFTTKPMGVGTGVGLPISLGIVQAHGGEINVGSSTLGGALFTVALPIAEIAYDEDVPVVSNVDVVSSGHVRLLIVDDEPEISSMLGDILANDKTHIDYAENGWSALGLISHHHYDAIISDLRMPGLDGEGLYRRIVAQYPAMASRVIFVTGDALSPNIARFLTEMDAPVIEKPFVPADVKRCLASLLEKRLELASA
ncbi:MAG: PAS domain S-box protein [Gammaproteobacteria bacterium]|nr:PAS domain S-box protein [Gammaproteobacteria bacterium]